MTHSDYVKAVFNILKAFPKNDNKVKNADVSDNILSSLVEKYGIVINKDVFRYYDLSFVLSILDKYVLSNVELNSTFHKSWDKVENAPLYQLVLEQVLHYFTTYGYEYLGVEGNTYIPIEKLELPKDTKINADKLIYIGILEDEGIFNAVVEIIKKDIAISDEYLENLRDILDYLVDKYDEYKKVLIDLVRNGEVVIREIKVWLTDRFDIIPVKSDDFMRWLIYKITGKTQIVKSKLFLENLSNTFAFKIKYDVDFINDVTNHIEEYITEYASSFRRYKDIWLSLKIGVNDNTLRRFKTVVNKLRKLSDKYHKPLKPSYFSSVTGLIKNNAFYIKTFERELKNTRYINKVRLLDAVILHINAHEQGLEKEAPHVFRVRNGEIYAIADFEIISDLELLYNLKDKLIESIADDLVGNFNNSDGKTYIVLSENVIYPLIRSVKDFTHSLPNGTMFKFDSNKEYAVVGIHWYNNGDRVDLDLSADSVFGLISWNSSYRNREMLFSGDLTDAPRPYGASEMILFKNDNEVVANVNVRNFSSQKPAPFKFFLGSVDKRYNKKSGENKKNFYVGRAFMIDRKSVKFIIPMNEISAGNGLVLGSFVNDGEGNSRFILGSSIAGRGRIYTSRDYMKWYRDFIFRKYHKIFGLNDVLDILKNKCDLEVVYNTRGIEIGENDTILDLRVDKVTINEFLKFVKN